MLNIKINIIKKFNKIKLLKKWLLKFFSLLIAYKLSCHLISLYIFIKFKYYLKERVYKEHGSKPLYEKFGIL